MPFRWPGQLGGDRPLTLRSLASHLMSSVTSRWPRLAATPLRRRRPQSQPNHPAAEIQQNLFPPRIARIAGAQLAGGLLPTYQVGGDWLDFVENRDGAWLAIADSAAKAPPSRASAPPSARSSSWTKPFTSSATPTSAPLHRDSHPTSHYRLWREPLEDDGTVVVLAIDESLSIVVPADGDLLAFELVGRT